MRRDPQHSHRGGGAILRRSRRAGRLHHITRDHTYAQLLVDTGQLAPAEVATSRHRHVLTNALGGSNEDVQVDIDTMQLEDGDRVLLCSDGLTDMVDDATITRIMLETPGSSEACERLVQQALETLMRGRTSIVIAHRLATVRQADRIYVIKDGTIAESGTHAELIARPNGVYRTLSELQFDLGEMGDSEYRFE